jgi:arylsulfatase A-like enzyme
MKHLCTLILFLCCHFSVDLSAAEKPNILFIAIDDQNDWLGHMGGHPMAKTPHLDKLAERGTTFLNAHCQAPLCNPSRTSLLLGLRPTTTGIYGLAPAPRAVPELRERVSLPQHFAAQGYRTAATGKIFHGGTSGGGGGKGKGKNKAAPTEANPIRRIPGPQVHDLGPHNPEFQVTAPFGGVGTEPPPSPGRR